MRKAVSFLALSFLCGVPVEAGDPTICRWTYLPPTIDGKGDDAAWKGAQSLGPFQRAWDKDPAKRKPLTATEAKLCWDRDNLYFFARMEDGDLFAEKTEHDADLWFDDVFELFFKPSAGFSGYYEFEFNPRNAVLDIYFPQRGLDDLPRLKKDFPFHLETAVKLEGTLNKTSDKDKGWTVEGKIPWSDFIRAGGRPRSGDVWKYAACRYDYSVDFDGPDLSSNAPLQRLSFHRYEDYLPLLFEGPQGDHPEWPFGLTSLPPVKGIQVKGRPGKSPLYAPQNAYPKLRGLGMPISVTAIPNANVLLAITQDKAYGRTRIIRFEDKPDVETFELVLSQEGTAYDFAFHPRFAENGYLFIGWNDGKATRISRFRLDPSTYVIDPDSEVVFLTWDGDGHNGGAIDFGPDGYLYVTTGDGSTDSDVLLNGQRTDGLHAKLLRIDVYKPADGKPYSVPADNPFVGQDGFAPETWAYGLRNPWRIDVDDVTGHVWVGNNGQDLWEQVYFVTKGANYGWSAYEGSRPFYPDRKLGPTPVSKPIFEHSHAESRSLTGGIVYRGKALPKLKGSYLYGDYSTGKIWAASHDGKKATTPVELADTSLKITDFNLDSRGELLVLDHGERKAEGAIHRLVPTPPDAKENAFPKTLSATGLFSNLPERILAPGVLSYSVNAEQWADGLSQRRALALPAFPDESGELSTVPIGFRKRGAWKLPEGVVLLKTLSFPGPDGARPVETQVLTLQDGDWAAYVYKWNDSGTDADLVGEGGEETTLSIPGPGGIRKQAWRHAGRAECMFCHSRAAGFALGMNSLQMNRDHPYAQAVDNQLRVLDRLSLLSDDWSGETRSALRAELLQKEKPERRQLPEVLDDVKDRVKELFGGTRPYPHARSDRLVRSPSSSAYARQADPLDEDASLDARARSYLQANCANCHVGAGGGNAMINLSHDVEPDKRELFDLKPKHLDFGIRDARLVSRGKPDRSVLLHRMTLVGPGQMPVIGRKTVDEFGADLIRRWIAEMKP